MFELFFINHLALTNTIITFILYTKRKNFRANLLYLFAVASLNYLEPYRKQSCGIKSDKRDDHSIAPQFPINLSRNLVSRYWRMSISKWNIYTNMTHMLLDGLERLLIRQVLSPTARHLLSWKKLEPTIHSLCFDVDCESLEFDEDLHMLNINSCDYVLTYFDKKKLDQKEKGILPRKLWCYYVKSRFLYIII